MNKKHNKEKKKESKLEEESDSSPKNHKKGKFLSLILL